MNDLLKPDFNCYNCGMCCESNILITEIDKEHIDKYLKEHSEIIDYIKKKTTASIECIFRDNINSKCLIHDVCPEICGIFGITNNFTCPHQSYCRTENYTIPTTKHLYLINNLYGFFNQKEYLKLAIKLNKKVKKLIKKKILVIK